MLILGFCVVLILGYRVVASSRLLRSVYSRLSRHLDS